MVCGSQKGTCSDAQVVAGILGHSTPPNERQEWIPLLELSWRPRPFSFIPVSTRLAPGDTRASRPIACHLSATYWRAGTNQQPCWTRLVYYVVSTVQRRLVVDILDVYIDTRRLSGCTYVSQAHLSKTSVVAWQRDELELHSARNSTV